MSFDHLAKKEKKDNSSETSSRLSDFSTNNSEELMVYLITNDCDWLIDVIPCIKT